MTLHGDRGTPPEGKQTQPEAVAAAATGSKRPASASPVDTTNKKPRANSSTTAPPSNGLKPPSPGAKVASPAKSRTIIEVLNAPRIQSPLPTEKSTPTPAPVAPVTPAVVESAPKEQVDEPAEPEPATASTTGDDAVKVAAEENGVSEQHAQVAPAEADAMDVDKPESAADKVEVEPPASVSKEVAPPAQEEPPAPATASTEEPAPAPAPADAAEAATDVEMKDGEEVQSAAKQEQKQEDKEQAQAKAGDHLTNDKLGAVEVHVDAEAKEAEAKE